MSYSKRERGEFIRSRIHHYILIALGKGEIDSGQAGDIYDLISFVETAGTTHSRELAQHPYYSKAIEEWRRCQELRRKRILESRSL